MTDQLEKDLADLDTAVANLNAAFSPHPLNVPYGEVYAVADPMTNTIEFLLARPEGDVPAPQPADYVIPEGWRLKGSTQ